MTGSSIGTMRGEKPFWKQKKMSKFCRSVSACMTAFCSNYRVYYVKHGTHPESGLSIGFEVDGDTLKVDGYGG